MVIHLINPGPLRHTIATLERILEAEDRCRLCGAPLEHTAGGHEGMTYDAVRCPNGCDLSEYLDVEVA